MAFVFFILIIISALFVIILIFSSKRFSPIPYFPTNKKDLPLIIKSLKLKNNQAIIDLGAGDGIVIFAAANEAYLKKLNTKFIAVDINPILIFILNLRRLFHLNKKNIKIVFCDFFKMNFSDLTTNYYLYPSYAGLQPEGSSKQLRGSYTRANSFASGILTTFYLYISPWFIDTVVKKILKTFPKSRIVSYMYPIKSLKKQEKIIRGKNLIFIYDF